MRHHFSALMKRINPPSERVQLASTRVAEVRQWLEDHQFPTESPHTRLSGSYGRSTAIETIPDVDVLLFVPTTQLERTPNSTLVALNKVLKDYPAAAISTDAQRRSVRLVLVEDELYLDIVPAVAERGLEKPLKVPDRPQQEWINSDPLGYARRLTSTNQTNGEKLVPLIKLFKAWRDENMVHRRPKSYVLEVILLYAVEGGSIVLCDNSVAQNVHDAFVHIEEKYAELMDNGSMSPRIRDPQIPDNFISKGWDREHFETFMRRIREAKRHAAGALSAHTEEEASDTWKKVFGSRWPTDEQVKRAIREEAAEHQPGLVKMASSGIVVGAQGGIPTLPTRYHGR